MLDNNSVGISVTQDYTYSFRDVLLYNISVGAKAEQLEYVYEKNLKAIPSFGMIPGLATFGAVPYYHEPHNPEDTIEGLKTAGSVQMDQSFKILKPLPTEGRLHVVKTIKHVYDRGEGRGAKLVNECVVTDEAGDVLVISRAGALNRFYGGFGGEKPPVSTVVIPDRAPDFNVSESFADNTAILYRLNGDTFPLHVDTEFAKACGFKKPIIHGLCVMGYACRILVDTLMPHRPEAFESMECRFSAPVFTGDSFTLQIWKEDGKSAVFRMINSEDKVVLDSGKVSYK